MSGHGGASPAKRKLFREEDKGQQKTNEKGTGNNYVHHAMSFANIVQ